MHRFVEPSPVHTPCDMRAVDEILARNAKVAAQEDKGRKKQRKK
jgi:hypothetical protein